MNLLVVGCSFHNTPIELRERSGTSLVSRSKVAARVPPVGRGSSSPSASTEADGPSPARRSGDGPSWHALIIVSAPSTRT